MEVLCERCQTEYEFDDALVSERGTTVKCTNCGHQFRIFRPRTLSSPPERWEVCTSDGRELIFTSLRDLQRGITRGQVGRMDVLRRGGLPSRALSEIAELEPFFPQSRATFESRPPVPSIHREDDEDSDFDEATIPRVSVGTDRTLPPVHALLGDEPGFEPETRRRPFSSSPDEAATQVVTDSGRTPQPSYPPRLPQPSHPPVSRAAEAKLKAPSEVAIHESQAKLMTPTPSDVRATYGAVEDAVSDPRFLSASPPKGSAAARWILGVVILGVVGVLVATVGRDYVMGVVASSTSPAPDPRVAALLDEGSRSMKEGDLESAKASFDKASVLVESDPHVLRALAHLANIRTDRAWLKLRLLEPEQKELIGITKAEFETRSRQAAEASERALELTPNDPDSVRIRVDFLRLSDELGAARALVPKITDRASEPDFAYVLAALEMSEKSPNWTMVVDRLRTSAAGEQDLGRARAALVVALLQSGQVEAAKTELQLLDKRPRPHALILELKAYFERMKDQVPDGGAASGGDREVLDPTKLPAAAKPGPAHRGDDAPGNEVLVGSYQDFLRRAHAAHQRGDLDGAEQLYRAVLAKNPGDTEALAGLGDIAKARGDKSASVGYYEEVNKQNPGYIPAIMGLADAKWDAGDKAGAVALYQQVLSATSGQGSYAARARQRIAEAKRADESSPTPTNEAPPAGADTSESPSP